MANRKGSGPYYDYWVKGAKRPKLKANSKGSETKASYKGRIFYGPLPWSKDDDSWVKGPKRLKANNKGSETKARARAFTVLAEHGL